MSERKIVNVSSYKRTSSLVKTIESIINQCDEVNIVLNDFEDDLPLLFYNDKVNLFFGDNSKGDAFKFLQLNHSDGYFLTIDDDLIYPPNYVDFMIAKCKEYGNTRVITLHGRNFKNFPITSYYKSATERYHCLYDVKQNTLVQFGGTGVMCFHTSLIKLPIDYFRSPNMADVWIGKHCIENKIEILCVRHDQGYIKYISQDSTIFDTHNNNDEIQTIVANSIFDKKIILDDLFGVKKDLSNIFTTKERSIPIKSTIEKSTKTINYERVNQIFNKEVSNTIQQPRNIVNNPKLKTNSSLANKFNQKRKR